MIPFSVDIPLAHLSILPNHAICILCFVYRFIDWITDWSIDSFDLLIYFSWRVKVEVDCSARCGDGFRIQSPFCIKKYGNSSETADITDNKHCAEMKMPPRKIPCHVSCTETRWEYSSWGKVSMFFLVFLLLNIILIDDTSPVNIY